MLLQPAMRYALIRAVLLRLALLSLCLPMGWLQALSQINSLRLGNTLCRWAKNLYIAGVAYGRTVS